MATRTIAFTDATICYEIGGPVDIDGAQIGTLVREAGFGVKDMYTVRAADGEVIGCAASGKRAAAEAARVVAERSLAAKTDPAPEPAHRCHHGLDFLACHLHGDGAACHEPGCEQGVRTTLCPSCQGHGFETLYEANGPAKGERRTCPLCAGERIVAVDWYERKYAEAAEEGETTDMGRMSEIDIDLRNADDDHAADCASCREVAANIADFTDAGLTVFRASCEAGLAIPSAPAVFVALHRSLLAIAEAEAARRTADSPCPECDGTGGTLRLPCDYRHGRRRDPEPERSPAERPAEGSIGAHHALTIDDHVYSRHATQDEAKAAYASVRRWMSGSVRMAVVAL